MRVVTVFFSVEDLPLKADESFPMKEALYGSREWLGTNEGENRIAIFEKLAPRSRPATRKPALKVFYSSALVEDYKPSKPNEAA